ncbi:unnamed protein product [Amoebophrya sp. A120]|nr:unnamed protein product [Amoebophrya sp. A120]|eukprot:GSA120T00017597001.1
MDEVPPEEGVFNRSEPQEQLPAFVLILSNLTHAAEFAIHYRSYYANPPGGEVEVPSRTVNDGSTKRLIASYWEEINFASEAALPLDHAKERRKKQVNSKARSATSTSTIDARHDKNLQRSYTVVPHPSRSYGQLFTTGTQLVVANTEWAAVLVEDEEAKGLHDTNAEESPTFNISGKDSSQTQDVEKIAVGPLYDFGVPVLKFHHLGVRDRYVAVLGNGTIATCSIRVTTTDGFPQLRVTASLDMFAERQESVVPSAARAAAHDAANVIGEKTAFSRLCRKSTSSLARRTSPTVVVEIINLDETSFGVVARAAIEQTAAESDEEQNPCWRLLFVSTAAAWKLHGAELIVPFASWLPGGLVAAQPAILKLRDKNDKHKTRGAGAHNGLQIWSLFADIASAGEGSRKGAGQDSATLSSHTYRVAIPYLNQRSAAWSWEFWQVDLNALQEKAQAILQAKEEFKIDNEKNEAPGDDDTFVEQISNISSRATLAAGGASDEGTENTLPARSEAVLQLDAAAAPAATDDLLSTLSEIVFDNQPPFRNFVWLFDKNHSWLAWYAYEYDGEIFSIILIAAGTFVYMRLWQNGKEDSGPAVDPRVWEDPCWNDPKKFRELYDAILSGVKESQDTDQAMSSPGGGCSAGATNGLRPF